MSLAKQEFTDAGKSMLGRAQNGEVLTVTKIVVGDGNANQPSDLWPLTNLIDTKLNVTISTKNDYGNGTMLVEGSFTSDAASAAFYLREVGVMAHIGAEADRLYSVANVFTDPADYIDPAAPTVQAFKIKLIIDRIPTANVIVQIGPSENVIGSNLGADTVGPGWYHDALGNVLNFKRIVQGTGMDIHDSADGNSVYVGVKTLSVDLDVYVPAAHPNAGNNPVFPTIQQAHDYLLQWRIPASRLARINIWKGTFTQGTLNFNHPDCKQIQVLGWPIDSHNVTRIDPVDKNTKKVTLDTTAHGLVANQIVYLPDCVYGFIGGCKVISAPAGMNYVNCSVPFRGNRGNTNPYNTSDVAARHLKAHTTIVALNDPNVVGSIWSLPYGIGLIQNLCVMNAAAPTKSYYALGGGSGALPLRNVQVFGPFRRCVSGGNDLVSLGGEIVLTDGDFGVTGPYLWLGVIATGDTNAICMINGCGQGVTPGGAGCAIAALIGNYPNVICYFSHCQYGINCGASSNAFGGTIVFDTCDYGLQVSFCGSVNFGTDIAAGTNQAYYMYNNALDVNAAGMGYVQLQYGNNGTSNPNCSPVLGAPDVNGTRFAEGNRNSYIYVSKGF
jgi:hypothetical protein